MPEKAVYFLNPLRDCSSELGLPINMYIRLLADELICKIYNSLDPLTQNTLRPIRWVLCMNMLGRLRRRIPFASSPQAGVHELHYLKLIYYGTEPDRSGQLHDTSSLTTQGSGYAQWNGYELKRFTNEQ
jgi:hypothetical protein